VEMKMKIKNDQNYAEEGFQVKLLKKNGSKLL